jgi:uroporphyrinogen-III decarboxylase
VAKTPVSSYQEKFERIQKAIKLEPVDRIPVIFAGMAFAPRFMGMSMADFCADPEAPVDTALDTMDKLGGFDGINAALFGRLTAVLPAMWLSRISIPGRDLPPDSLWQVRETEVMTIDDYDYIINKGWPAFQRYYLPRVTSLADFDDASGWIGKNAARCVKRFPERNYVVISATSVGPPYENFCGGRSMEKFIGDLYRIPDKVQAAMDVALPDIIQAAIGGAKASGSPGVWVGGWRTASSLVSPRLMNRFVWPYVVKIVDALVAAGLTPIFHWDQDWTQDLVRLQEIPARKCILNPDGMTDMRKFKKLAGDRVAMMGDVPSTLFVTGTPDDIYNYVKGLVDLFGATGLLLCPGCDAPINAQVRNVEAFVAASHKLGIPKK